MMNGASTLEGYVPDVDATIVTRILDAGGEIIGKADCEYFCFSGGSHTNADRAGAQPAQDGLLGRRLVVRQRRRGRRRRGRDGDRRRPGRLDPHAGAYCGVYGLKPTHGLVPYTGVFPIEITLDHTGPMTATVADNALLLEVLAGPDGLDPRQTASRRRPTPARSAAAQGHEDRRREGGLRPRQLARPMSTRWCEGRGQRSGSSGATVDEVSIPMHLDGMAIWTPIAVEGATEQMMNGNGFGFNWKGLYITSLIDAHSSLAPARRRVLGHPQDHDPVRAVRAQQVPRPLLRQGQNLGRQLRAAYDAVLKDYDLLLMPTRH